MLLPRHKQFMEMVFYFLHVKCSRRWPHTFLWIFQNIEWFKFECFFFELHIVHFHSGPIHCNRYESNLDNSNWIAKHAVTVPIRPCYSKKKSREVTVIHLHFWNWDVFQIIFIQIHYTIKLSLWCTVCLLLSNNGVYVYCLYQSVFNTIRFWAKFQQINFIQLMRIRLIQTLSFHLKKCITQSTNYDVTTTSLVNSIHKYIYF